MKNKIKILWFANTPCGASDYIDKKTIYGGWLDSLEKQLKSSDSIELSICFYHNKSIKYISAKNVTYFPVKRKIFSNKFLLFFYNIFNCNDDENELNELMKIVNDVDPHIIHVHGTEDNFGLLSTKIRNIPIIISIQGLLNPITEKYYAGIPKFYSFIHEPIHTFLLFASTFWSFRFFKKNANRELKILKNSKYIIGRTNFDKSVSRLLAPLSIYYINNEILRDDFYKNIFSNTKKKGVINVVSIISNGHYKGLETLVKSYYFIKQNTEVKISLNIIGLSKSDSYVKLVYKYLNLDLKKSEIEFLGRKNPQEVLKVFNQSDVYCQSSHIENSSNSLCEAMISGIPIIASFAGGTNSLFDDEKEGILYQAGDSYSLSGCILEISNNYEEAISRASVARDRAISRHDIKKITNKLIDIYKKIINQHEI